MVKDLPSKIRSLYRLSWPALHRLAAFLIVTKAIPASDDRMPRESCYTYNHGVVERALRTAAMRDFSNSPEL